LDAAVTSPDPYPEDEAKQWIAIVEELRVHLVLELCDPVQCELASNVLLSWLSNPSLQSAAAQIFVASSPGMTPPTYGIMRHIFKGNQTM
jgi:hypothetical protein